LHDQAAIDGILAAGDVRGIVREKKERNGRRFFGAARATERHPADDGLFKSALGTVRQEFRLVRIRKAIASSPAVDRV